MAALEGRRKSKAVFSDAVSTGGEPGEANHQSGDADVDSGVYVQGSLLDASGLPGEAYAKTPQAPTKSKNKDTNVGHRQRLRERFMKGGPDAIPDYEMLELILFRAIPRGDTKPAAKRMLKRFGTFSEVINAPPHLLKEVSGIGDAAIVELKLVREAALRLMRDQVMDRPVLSSWATVLEYCRAQIGYERTEQFRILFLDRKNKLIGDEMQSRGTVDHTPVYVREVVKRALELSATAIILVHNHPSGDLHPSRAGIEMTRQIETASKPLGIIIHDHIIVSRDGYVSFRNLGLL